MNNELNHVNFIKIYYNGYELISHWFNYFTSILYNFIIKLVIGSNKKTHLDYLIFPLFIYKMKFPFWTDHVQIFKYDPFR